MSDPKCPIKNVRSKMPVIFWDHSLGGSKNGQKWHELFKLGSQYHRHNSKKLPKRSWFRVVRKKMIFESISKKDVWKIYCIKLIFWVHLSETFAGPNLLADFLQEPLNLFQKACQKLSQKFEIETILTQTFF